MKNILPGLHSLRGWAALAVIIYHVQAMPQLEIPGYLTFIKIYFGLGVTLFFVISAFSLFLSTFNRVNSRDWIYFYFIKRIFRIAPLFYVMLIVYLLFVFINFGLKYIRPLEEIFINVTFLYNFFPGKHESMVWAGWTIGVEMLFYLIVPYLLMSIRSFYKSLIACFVFLTISLASRNMYAQLDLPKLFDYMSILSQLGVFVFGIPAYFMYEKYKHNKNAAMLGKSLLITAILAAIVVVIVQQGTSIYSGYSIYMWAFVFAVLILSQTLSPFILFTNKVFTYLGNLSFSLYLLHPLTIHLLKPVYQLFYGLNINTAFALLLSLIVTALGPSYGRQVFEPRMARIDTNK